MYCCLYIAIHSFTCILLFYYCKPTFVLHLAHKLYTTNEKISKPKAPLFRDIVFDAIVMLHKSTFFQSYATKQTPLICFAS